MLGWRKDGQSERERELVINQVGSRGQREAGGKERERESSTNAQNMILLLLTTDDGFGVCIEDLIS